MLGGVYEEDQDAEKSHLLPKTTQAAAEAAIEDTPGIELTEQARREIARKRVKRIFKLPLTFKRHTETIAPQPDITPTPISSTEDEIKRFQKSRPPGHFLITDYCKSEVRVRCEPDFRNAARPDWATVRWIHLDSIQAEMLPILKENLPAHITIKDITRPSHKFRVEEHERYVLLVLHLVANYDENAAAARRSLPHSSRRTRPANEISTIRLVVFLFFETNTLVTVTETPETQLANCVLTRLSRDPSRIRNSDCSYLLYYILKFTLAPLQMIINFHSQYLEMMEDKITFQHMEVASYQNIFHEIHEIRRELQHLRERLINIADAIDDIREISDREAETRANAMASIPQPVPITNVERNGIFPDRLKLSSVVRLQFKHLSSNTMQMVNQTSTLQEICSWLADLVFQTLSQKMNMTMKTLTLVSMVFIPLTFIVGVYGTNFEFLPELRWKYGYIFLWAICILVVVIELVVFRRMHWI